MNFETRTLHPQFAEEMETISSDYGFPAGWPFYSIRPINGFSWNTYFSPAPTSGVVPPSGPRAGISVFPLIANLAIISAVLASFVYTSQRWLSQFSVINLLGVLAATAVVIVGWRIASAMPIRAATNVYAVSLYFSPLALVVGRCGVHLWQKAQNRQNQGLDAEASKASF